MSNTRQYHLTSSLIQKSLGIRIAPQLLSLMSGKYLPDGFRLKFCNKAVTHKNIVFLEKVSPGHNRRPALNGNEKSFLIESLLLKSKNLSGLKFSGSFQNFLSLFNECKLARAKVSFGIS